MPTPPDWIQVLADRIAACLEPLEPLPPLGCHYHDCESGWEISVFPSQTEVVGGIHDGLQTTPRFRVDVLGIAELFSQVDEISWQSRPVDESDDLGAHISLSGKIGGESVSIRILKRSPACFTPGRKALTREGYLLETW